MHAERGIKGTTTIAAACLVLGLWVAGCTPGPSGSAGPNSDAISPAQATPRTSPDITPAPNTDSASSAPATAGPTAFGPDAFGPVTSAPASAPLPSSTPAVSGSTSAVTPASRPPTAAQTPEPLGTSPTAPPATTRKASPLPGTSAPAPTGSPTVIAVDAAEFGPAVYYVAIDDGGARGVRFGCNDSLVPIRGVAAPGDPLSVALGRLLEAGMPVDSDAALYDSLANSSLRYLSGYMSGATVIVNLSGSLRPGGVCDIPRIQAQLTQTIVQASGASRAEIYVNGRTLTEALSVR